MGIMVLKKGKWMEAPEWREAQWEMFADAAKAQAALDDCVAYASEGLIAVEDLAILDMQCQEMNHVSLARFYNDCRAIGRAEVLVAAKAAAERSASMGPWFGDKVLQIDAATQEGEQSVILVDV